MHVVTGCMRALDVWVVPMHRVGCHIPSHVCTHDVMCIRMPEEVECMGDHVINTGMITASYDDQVQSLSGCTPLESTPT